MQAVKGLNKACGVILHSDQGWQYQMVDLHPKTWTPNLRCRLCPTPINFV